MLWDVMVDVMVDGCLRQLFFGGEVFNWNGLGDQSEERERERVCVCERGAVVFDTIPSFIRIHATQHCFILFCSQIFISFSLPFSRSLLSFLSSVPSLSIT